MIRNICMETKKIFNCEISFLEVKKFGMRQKNVFKILLSEKTEKKGCLAPLPYSFEG